ncbi:hypothetical protein H0H92_005405 [Tricholoma furcatifolium]|nr:hypothetical protein H0H92_005405 [Tricholoma furcatifolium]
MFIEKVGPAQNTNSSQANDIKPGTESYIGYDINPGAERAFVRKLDIILLPMFALAFLISLAATSGIEEDLGMVGLDYNIALTVFYLFYIAVDIPSNLILKRLGSSWLAALITLFGIVSISTAFVKTYAGLIVTRVFLGLAEGGTLDWNFLRGVNAYSRRMQVPLSKEEVSAASYYYTVGGLLASGLLSVPDFGSVSSWRKIFLIEGIITTGFGLLCFLIFPADPRHTHLLNEEERALALARIDADQAVRTQGRREKTTFRLVTQALSIHLRTVPPYVVAAVWSVVVTYISYKIGQRGVIVIICGLFMVAGYAISVGTDNPHARYAACFLSLAGASPGGPMVLAWATDNAAPDTVRAVATAIVPGTPQPFHDDA